MARRTVIVTGGVSGIGAACGMHFARAGWNVVASYLAEECREGADAAVEAARQNRASGAAVQANISLDRDCLALVAAADREYGRVDALVNAAGMTRMVPLADLDALSPEIFHEIYAVNLIGPFLMSRAAARLLKRSGDGAIVNISSLAARTGGGSSIAYAASKGALNSLTCSLARALAPEVRVNAVAPALVEGGFVQRLDADLFEQRRAAQIDRAPLRRVGRPADIAETVYWLVTGAPLMTGEVLTADCGLHLNADS